MIGFIDIIGDDILNNMLELILLDDFFYAQKCFLNNKIVSLGSDKDNVIAFCNFC